MSTLTDIEQRTGDYAKARRELADRVAILHAQIDRVVRQEMPGIREAMAQAQDAKAGLEAAIEAAPELFRKPRTRTFCGIKIGLQRTKGKVTVPDEAVTIARIRERLPAEQAELLISTKESVYKPGLFDLELSDLRRIGASFEAGKDKIIVKPVDGDIDKMIKTVLDDATHYVEEEDAA